jgi:hypothetical protein
MAAVEGQLLASAKVPATSGNSLGKGTPREAFIRDFLSAHLGAHVYVGTGEIIDGDSKAGEKRPQIDVVIARSDLPRLALGGAINTYLAESVVATVEVKSFIDEAKLKDAIATAARIKALKRESKTVLTAGYQAPSILTFVVAYAGPAKMATVYNWIENAYAEQGLTEPALPMWPERARVASTSLDGVFVIGKGYVLFNNSVVSTVLLKPEHRTDQRARWLIVDQARGALYIFFLLLTMALSGVALGVFQPGQYVEGFTVSRVGIGSGFEPTSP